ncbi:MAG: hypothetical protein ACFFCW_33740 [Candidatus Hodarchaeota archaeon]
MKILWIEDFGGGLSPSQVVIEMFKDIIPQEVFDLEYDPRIDVSIELPRLFEKHTFHQIYICKSYSEWKEKYHEHQGDFDIALLDVNLEAQRTPNSERPIDNPGFDENAGLYIYHQLVKDGFLEDNIAFFTGYSNTFKFFSELCYKIFLEPPRHTFEKTSEGFGDLREWLYDKINYDDYLILRRGIIEGCHFLKEHLMSSSDEGLEKLLLFHPIILEEFKNFKNFYEITSPKVRNWIHIYKGNIIQYLRQLEEFFPLRPQRNKNALYVSFLRELASRWEKYRFYTGKESITDEKFQGKKKQSLPFSLQKDIIELLMSLPNSDDIQAQRALVYSAGLDTQLHYQIHFSNSPAQFFQLLIPTLNRYGILEDGRNAIEAVLDSVKNSIGQEGKQCCDRLIHELHKIPFTGDYSEPLIPSTKPSLEYKFIKNIHNQMKLLRNWAVHDLISTQITAQELAYFFMIAMRAMIHISFTNISIYEKILASLFSPISEKEMKSKMNEKLELYLQDTYKALLRELNEEPDPSNNFIYLLNNFVISAHEVGGKLSKLLKTEIQAGSINYFYQSFWHGLFPVLTVVNNKEGLLRFEIEPIPPETFVSFLGKLIFRNSIATHNTSN